VRIARTARTVRRLPGQHGPKPRNYFAAASFAPPASLTNVTAVPEPHEWLLLGVALLILGAWLRREQRWQLSVAAIRAGLSRRPG
jgi:hypothetical protein